jgi:hypothetical protein
VLAALAIAVTITAPGFGKQIPADDLERWARAQQPRFPIQAAWTEGEAAERGIVVTTDEAREAADAQPRSRLTRADRLYKARIDLLSARIRDQIAQPAATSVTQEQIDAYVQAHPRLDPETRETRVLRTAGHRQARRARAALRRGLSWRSAIDRYSAGGSSVKRTVERSPGGLDRAIFRARANVLTRYGAYVFKVIKVNPPRPAPQDQQRATAWEILASEAQERALGEFHAAFRAKWLARTACAPAYADHPDCPHSR